MSFDHVTMSESLVPEDLLDLPKFNGVRSALVSNRAPKLYAANPLPFHRRVGDDVMGFGQISPTEFIDSVLKLGVRCERMAKFEEENALAFRPFELNDPLKLHSNLFEYFSEPVMSYDSVLLKQCFDKVIMELRGAKSKDLLRPLSLDESFKLIPAGTNSGLPFYTSSRWTPDMILDYKSRAYLVQQGDASCLYPYILQLRLQPKQNSVSHRVVWNPDKAELIAAKTITQPTLELMQELPYYRGYLGPHKMPELMEQLFHDYDTYVSLDFSSFDKTIKGVLMNYLADGLIDLWGKEQTPLIRALFKYYTNGPILFANEQKKLRLLNGTHGVPSGVGATFLTSLINRACWIYVASVLKIPSDKWFHIANGDDTILAIRDHKFDLDQVASEFLKLGLIVSTDRRKSHLTHKGENPYMVFLSRYYFSDDCSGIFPLTKAALTLYFQERYKTQEMTLVSLGFDPDVAGGAQICRQADMIGVIQRIENCKNHKQFESFVNYIQFSTPGYLDPLMWDNRWTDMIADNRETRAGRGSRAQGLRTFATATLIYETSTKLNNELFKLYETHVDDRDFDVKDFPACFKPAEVTKEQIIMANHVSNQSIEQVVNELKVTQTQPHKNDLEQSIKQEASELKMTQTPSHETALKMAHPPSIEELNLQLTQQTAELAVLDNDIRSTETEVKDITEMLEVANNKLVTLKATRESIVSLIESINVEIETLQPKTELEILRDLVQKLTKEVSDLKASANKSDSVAPAHNPVQVTNSEPQKVEKVAASKPIKVDRRQPVSTEVATERPIVVPQVSGDGTRLGTKKSQLAAVMERLQSEMSLPPLERNTAEIARLSTERTQLASSINQMEKARGNGNAKSKTKRRADRQATRLQQKAALEEWLENNHLNKDAYYQVQLAKLAALISAISASEASNAE